MAAPSTWTVVRDILTADLTLTTDQVIARAKAKGVKAQDGAIRTTLYDVRKKLKQKAAAKPAPAPKPAAAKAVPAARRTPAPSTSAVLRSILATDLALPADAVIAKAKARGVTVPDGKLRDLVHNLKSQMRRHAAKATAAVLPPLPRSRQPRSRPRRSPYRRSPRRPPRPQHPPMPTWPGCCRTSPSFTRRWRRAAGSSGHGRWPRRWGRTWR